jgi:hypothetical protein
VKAGRDGARVVMVCLDGFPVRHLGPELTPSLLALAASGGAAPDGGRAIMPSSTYVNHATLLTGAAVAEHGVLPGGVPPAPPWERRVVTPTLFDRLAERRRETRAVLGDHHLVRVLGLDGAEGVWPPTPVVPEGVVVDDHGWIVDDETLPRVVEAVDSGADFVFGHFNDPDTAGHDLGPDSPGAAECYRRADAALGVVVEAARDDWERTIVIAVSDHDMLPRGPQEPVAIVDERIALAVPEGGAAWLWPAEGRTSAEAWAAGAAAPGVADVIDVGGLPLAVLEPGLIAYWPTLPERGFHGGEAARRTLAVVGGGHPAARALGARIAERPPPIGSWAGIVLDLLA